MTDGRRGWSRRQVVGSAVAGVAVTIAGCSSGAPDGADDGDGGAGAETDEGRDAGGSGNVHDVPSVSDHPVDERVPFEDDHQCAICRMPVTDYPEWMGQLAHADGTGIFTCTPGCLVAYYGAGTSAWATDAPVERAWTTTYGTTNRIDAATASFALEREGDGREEPMHPNPRPFPSEAEALAFVADDPALSAADVIRFDDVDRELAEFYRGRRI